MLLMLILKMKRIIRTTIISLILLILISSNISAQTSLNGYSEWSEEKTGDKEEISAIQYGRKLPLIWSEWSEEKTNSLYQKSRIGNKKHFSYNGENKTWKDAKAKELFTWDFGGNANVTYFYGDVDTYVSDSWTKYEGPPLQLYCDGELIASIGTHDAQKNWNPKINCDCQYLKLSMSSNSGSGRNRTSIVGSWATTTMTEYSHVLKWNEGSDWRFNEEYEELFGEDSQLPTERIVYSHPITYHITYNLDGGKALGDFVYTYTVLDEVSIPKATKLGYEFIGWKNSDGEMYEKIDIGTYKDLDLTAIYERKNPTIYIGNTSFEQDNKTITMSQLIEIVKAKAKDDLDGDISEKIVVEKIEYSLTKETIYNPSLLDLSKSQRIIVEFSVTNSGNKKVFLKKEFYILGKYEINDDENENIKIYSRFINDDYLDTLDDDSIWRSDNYKLLLSSAIEKMKGD